MNPKKKKVLKRPPTPHRQKGDYFFGWNNTKWFIREVGAMYSGKISYFSKKRLESGISFVIGQIGMIVFLALRYQTLTMSEFITWASLEFAVGGFITWQIQKQKKFDGYGYEDDYSDDGALSEHLSPDDNLRTTNGPI